MSARVPPVGGRRQRQSRNIGMVVEQRPQLPIVGPEIVPPFADAMGFVDRDQRELHAAHQPAERSPVARSGAT